MSESNQNVKRKAPLESPASEILDDVSTDDHSSVPGTATYNMRYGLAQEEKTPRRRRKFNPQRRIEVAKVRRIGACESCRSRKIRCPHALGEDDPDTTRLVKPSPPRIHFESYNPDLVKGDSGNDPQPDSQKPELLDLQILVSDNGGPSDWEQGVPTPTGRLNQVTSNVRHLEGIIEGNHTGSQQPMLSEPWSGLVNGSQSFQSRPFVPSTNIRSNIRSHSDAGYARASPRGVQKNGAGSRRLSVQQKTLQLPFRTTNNPSPQHRIPQRGRMATRQDIGAPAVEHKLAPAEPKFMQGYDTSKLPFVESVQDLYLKEEQESIIWSNYEDSQGDWPRPTIGSQFTMGLADIPQPIGTDPSLEIWQQFCLDDQANTNLLEGQPSICSNSAAYPDLHESAWDMQLGFDKPPPCDSQFFPSPLTSQPQLDQFSGGFPLHPQDSALAASDFVLQMPFNTGNVLSLDNLFNSNQPLSANLNPPSMEFGPSSSSSGEFPTSHNFTLPVDDPECWKPSMSSKFGRKADYGPAERRL